MKRMAAGGALALALMMYTNAEAGKGPFSLGVIIGAPTGLSADFDLGSNRSLDAALAWSSGKYERMYFHMDHLWHHGSALPDLDLPWYWGIGGRLLTRDDNRDRHQDDDDYDAHLGVRLPLGVRYRVPDTAVTFFAEIAPVVDLVPDSGLQVTGGLGVRFRF
jgi:hypothetical protein